MYSSLLQVRIRRAKNDQLGMGRCSFFECDEGSNMERLLSRWRSRSEPTSRFVFPNLNSKQKLTSSAISSTTKKLLAEAGVSEVSHHGLRRGAANYLQAEGLSREEIQTRGRWRSQNGLARYLQDNSKAQGVSLGVCYLRIARRVLTIS